MTEDRPLLSCECVVCPSHEDEITRLHSTVEALTAAFKDASSRLVDKDVEIARLRAALEKSGDRYHGLNDGPVHLRHLFRDCPDDTCKETRAALGREA